jgi:hypothetical protein
MLADIEIAKQFVKFNCRIEVIIIRQGHEKQTFAELTGTNKKLIPVAFAFQQLNIPRLIHISIIVKNDVSEI